MIQMEPISSNSNTEHPDGQTSLPDWRILSSQESCNKAGIKDLAVPKPEEKSGEAAVHPRNRPDAQSVSVKPSVEKIQHRIFPLLGKPYFTCIICKSHIYPPFQVVVPKAFAAYLPSKSVCVSLTCRNRSWEMRFTGGRIIQRLEAGWRSFALDNNLKIGDGCVFELIDSENVMFRVQILRGEIPPKIRHRAGGYTSSSPILID